VVWSNRAAACSGPKVPPLPPAAVSDVWFTVSPRHRLYAIK
jgi:hypothetical protein